MKAPNSYTSLALKTCEFHLHAHRAFELKPSTILTLFNKLDVWRKYEEFELFLDVCQADFNGRLGQEETVYQQRDYLEAAANAARDVSAKVFIEQGYQGKAIKEQIDKEKLNKIEQVKLNWLKKE